MGVYERSLFAGEIIKGIGSALMKKDAGINLFNYASNNSVGRIDNLGLKWLGEFFTHFKDQRGSSTKCLRASAYIYYTTCNKADKCVKLKFKPLDVWAEINLTSENDKEHEMEHAKDCQNIYYVDLNMYLLGLNYCFKDTATAAAAANSIISIAASAYIYDYFATTTARVDLTDWHAHFPGNWQKYQLLLAYYLYEWNYYSKELRSLEAKYQ